MTLAKIMTASLPVIEVLYQGKRWELSPDSSDARSNFGGPLSDRVESSVSLRKAALHSLGTINLPKFGVNSFSHGFSIPLLYGICHEGCEIEYKKTAPSAIEIITLDPKKADSGYPYHGYPAILPYYELGISLEAEISLEGLQDRIANTGWEANPDFFYVIVMQHPHVGHCLFEPDGDVEVVFEYQPDAGVFRATNQCG